MISDKFLCLSLIKQNHLSHYLFLTLYNTNHHHHHGISDSNVVMTEAIAIELAAER